ncbi:hypothetical protein KUV89_03765 [Marinobacter hydrocarbonoclasticus]|nr:hypothetical protein [Marinobacter nauticus]
MITALFWVGVAMMATGGGLLLWTELSQQVPGMVVIACLLGLGFVLSTGAKILWFIRKSS